MRAGAIDEKWKWLRIVFPGDCSPLSIPSKLRTKLMFVISNNESPAEGMGYLCHRKNSQKRWDVCLFMIKVQYRDCILLLYRMHRWPYRSPTSLKTLISDITWHHWHRWHNPLSHIDTNILESIKPNQAYHDWGTQPTRHSMRCLMRVTTQITFVTSFPPKYRRIS